MCVCVYVCVGSPLEKMELDLGLSWPPPWFLEGQVFPLPNTCSLGWHGHTATNGNGKREKIASNFVFGSDLPYSLLMGFLHTLNPIIQVSQTGKYNFNRRYCQYQELSFIISSVYDYFLLMQMCACLTSSLTEGLQAMPWPSLSRTLWK